MENIPANDYIEQLKNNPAVQQWLSKFKYGNKDKFIEAYVNLKYKLKDKSCREGTDDGYRSECIEVAESALEAILAKKIFDLELRWRAEEITIDGVEISFDISRWLNEPLNCPFAPEISGEDIEIMKAFLVSPDFENYKLDEHNCVWHDEIRAALNDSVEEQYWFKFYNNHASNPVPFNLPDIRGQKEEYYFEKDREFNREENAKLISNTSTYKHLGMMEGFDIMAKLAEAAGLSDFSTFLKDKSFNYNGRNPVWPDYAWFYLNIHYDDKIPIRADKNWSNALVLAYQRHAAKGAVEHLQSVVDAYRMRKENKITQENVRGTYERIAKKFRDIILDTREKLGEPRNFDF